MNFLRNLIFLFFFLSCASSLYAASCGLFDDTCVDLTSPAQAKILKRITDSTDKLQTLPTTGIDLGVLPTLTAFCFICFTHPLQTTVDNTRRNGKKPYLFRFSGTSPPSLFLV